MRSSFGPCLIALFFLGFLALPSLGAQGANPSPNLLDELRTHSDNESWSAAVELGQRIVETDPRQGEAWLLLAVALRQQERFADSITAAHNAVDLGYQPARSNTTLALAYAETGDIAASVAALRSAVEAGLPVSVVETHPGLETLRLESGYGEVLALANRLTYPCEHEARYRALDFWIGSWDVFMGDQQVGQNQITKLQRGCLVHESWTSASGTRGESINFYDPKTGEWTQRWVDENGGVVWYTGGPTGQGFHMSGENIDSEGNVKAARVTLSPNDDGTVRHLIEHSDDGGETWSIWFDALYRRAASPPVD